MFLKTTKFFIKFLSFVLKLLMVGLILYQLHREDYGLFFVILLSFILTLLPLILRKREKIYLAWYVNFAITAAFFIFTFGISFDYYDTITWWSKVSHFFGTAVIAGLAFLLVYALNFIGKVKMSTFLIGIFTIAVAIAIGSVWEISEFYIDKFFHTDLTGDFNDLINDLRFDILGGILVAIMGILYVKVARHERLYQIFQPVFYNKNKDSFADFNGNNNGNLKNKFKKTSEKHS